MPLAPDAGKPIFLLNEAADRDTVVAFVGRPHRIDDRGSQLLKSLKEIGFQHYLQAEQTGWVLYLEGSTDLAILRGFAEMLEHPAREALARPFVHYVGNQPRQAQHHFYGLCEAKSDLKGIATYDRDVALNDDPNLVQLCWRRREIENYLCQRETLLGWAHAKGSEQHGELFGSTWRQAMDEAIDEIARALAALGKGDPWGADIKASDEFLGPLFRKFFEKIELPNLMAKTDDHTLVPFVPRECIDPQIGEVLDRIAEIARTATRPEGPDA